MVLSVALVCPSIHHAWLKGVSESVRVDVFPFRPGCSSGAPPENRPTTIFASISESPKRGGHWDDYCSLCGGGIANTTSGISGRQAPTHPSCLHGAIAAPQPSSILQIMICLWAHLHSFFKVLCTNWKIIISYRKKLYLKVQKNIKASRGVDIHGRTIFICAY